MARRSSMWGSPGGRTTTWRWEQERPHPAYLVSLVVAPYVETKAKAGRVPLRFYAFPGQEKAARRLYGRTADMVKTFERLFGPYPWREYAQTVVSATTLRAHDSDFPAESLLARVRSAVPDAAITNSEMLATYDSYYYSRDGLAPLPVLRVKLDDPDRTWLYIDPRMSQLVGRVHRLDRVERWLYNGLHSLNFPWLYNYRPLWDIVVITLMLGGTALCVTSLVLAWRVLGRKLARTFNPKGAGAALSEDPA